jgi:hypothetical protein
MQGKVKAALDEARMLGFVGLWYGLPLAARRATKRP